MPDYVRDTEEQQENTNFDIDEMISDYTEEVKKIYSDTEGVEVVDLNNYYYEPPLSSGDDKLFVNAGSIELDNYYNWGYSDSKDIAQSFRLRDFNGETLHLYMDRTTEKYQQLVEKIESGDNVHYLLLIERYDVDIGSQYMAEIVTSS